MTTNNECIKLARPDDLNAQRALQRLRSEYTAQRYAEYQPTKSVTDTQKQSNDTSK